MTLESSTDIALRVLGQKEGAITERYAKGVDLETALPDGFGYGVAQLACAMSEGENMEAERWEKALSEANHGNWELLREAILADGALRIGIGTQEEKGVDSTKSKKTGWALVNLAVSMQR